MATVARIFIPEPPASALAGTRPRSGLGTARRGEKQHHAHRVIVPARRHPCAERPRCGSPRPVGISFCSALPPEMAICGGSRGQLTKCFWAGKADRPSPASVRIVEVAASGQAAQALPASGHPHAIRAAGIAARSGALLARRDRSRSGGRASVLVERPRDAKPLKRARHS